MNKTAGGEADEETGRELAGEGFSLQQPENIPGGVDGQVAVREEGHIPRKLRLIMKNKPPRHSYPVGGLGGPRDKVHGNGLDGDKIMNKQRTNTDTPLPHPQ